MARTVFSFHYIVESRKGKRDSNRFGINFFVWRNKNHIATGFFEHFEIGDFVARIIFQIFGVVELNWIHKNAANSEIIFGFRSLNERNVATMQKSHGWNKSNTCFCRLVLKPLFVI
jgi:hypothetical protein